MQTSSNIVTVYSTLSELSLSLVVFVVVKAVLKIRIASLFLLFQELKEKIVFVVNIKRRGRKERGFSKDEK